MKRLNGKNVLAGVLTAALAVTMVGCGNGQKIVTNEGKVSISVGNWPTNKEDLNYEAHQKWLEAMNKENPDIEIIPDSYQYATDSFFVKAASGQLPTVFLTWFTEVNKIKDAGYCADITSQMSEFGFDEALNPIFKDVLGQDGKYYAVPSSAYAEGLAVNKTMFEAAGLTNPDGTVMVPKTYDDLVEYAKKIKEATGKAGLVLPTAKNNGGWHFMNIAWSYGVEFMEQGEDGKWRAAFNSPECVAALQYVKDLKWKHDVLPENAIIDLAEMKKLFATNEAAMFFQAPPGNELYTNYSMDKNTVAFVGIPEGPQGKYSLMGGNIYMVSNQATEKEKDAVFKWFENIGVSPKTTDTQIAAWKNSAESQTNKGGIVLGEDALKIWVNPEYQEKQREILSPYINVNPVDFEDYFSFENVIIQPEEPQSCQQLYGILDACIQEVLTNENADVEALVADAASNFQVNYLDKLEN